MDKKSHLQTLTNSKYGVGFALYLGRTLPAGVGYRVANLLGTLFALQRRSLLVQTVRHNQFVISGEKLQGKALAARVRTVFVHAATCLYDFYHNLEDNERLLKLIVANETAQKLIEGSQDPNQGALVVAPHVSNFDVLLLSLSAQGLQGQVLSYAKPTSGYSIQNRLRAHFGLTITPANLPNIQQAIENMRNGGYVYTAVDRPSTKYRDRPLPFFGHPAALPAGYINMALEASVPILPVCAHGIAPGRYELWMDEPLHVETRETHQETLRHNATRVLKRFEQFISRTPEQWLMYYPVWPDLPPPP